MFTQISLVYGNDGFKDGFKVGFKTFLSCIIWLNASNNYAQNNLQNNWNFDLRFHYYQQSAFINLIIHISYIMLDQALGSSITPTWLLNGG